MRPIRPYQWYHLRLLGLLLLSLVLSACAQVVRPVAPASHAPPTAPGGQLQGTVVDLQTQRFVAFDILADAAAGVQVVAVGEEHYHPDIQAFELRLLQALAQRRPHHLALAMEFLERDAQPAVDDYLAGTIDEATFQRRISAAPDFMRLYFPLIKHARQARIPILAMNIPRRLARQVAQEGLQPALDRLSSSERAYVPSSLSPVAPRYRTYFLEAVASSHPLQEAQVERFVASAHIKDETMAESLAGFLDRHPDYTVLAIAGRFHMDYGLALPSLLRQRRQSTTIQRLTTMTVTADDAVDLRRLAREELADYVWFVQPRSEDKPRAEAPRPEAHDM